MQMPLNLNRPLAVFDLETTGLDQENDRIVEIAIIKVMPSGTHSRYYSRVDPEIDIPTRASEVHWIYQHHVANAPNFSAIAPEVVKFLQDCDLAGYNVKKFDIPVLEKHLERAEIPNWSLQDRRVVDGFSIFCLMEKKDLSSAFRFYCGQELQNAHTAMADAEATLAILEAQVERYENKPIATNGLGNESLIFQNNVAALDALSRPTPVHIVDNPQGIPTINFGKYKGMQLQLLLQTDPGYVDWIVHNPDFPSSVKERLQMMRQQRGAQPSRSLIAANIQQHDNSHRDQAFAINPWHNERGSNNGVPSAASLPRTIVDEIKSQQKDEDKNQKCPESPRTNHQMSRSITVLMLNVDKTFLS